MRGFWRSMVVLAVALASGCSSMKLVQLGPEPRRLSSSRWIVLGNGERLELRDGRVTRDSVVGIYGRLHRAIPRDSVVSVEQRENPSAVPFVMLGALAVAAAIGIASQPIFGEGK